MCDCCGLKEFWDSGFCSHLELTEEDKHFCRACKDIGCPYTRYFETQHLKYTGCSMLMHWREHHAGLMYTPLENW